MDNKIHETVETINSMKTHREFYLSFARDPQLFINKWLISQSKGGPINRSPKMPRIYQVRKIIVKCSVCRFEDHDRCRRQPRGGACGRLLLPTMGAGSCLPILLQQNPAKETRARLGPWHQNRLNISTNGPLVQ